MRVLVSGGEGQVGRALADLASGDHDIVALGRRDLDLTDKNSIEAAILNHRPDTVINAAAYTAVDAAESDEAGAYAVNAEGATALAKAAASHGAGFVHISTDYVFDGSGGRPYRETDPTGPLCAYGRTKLAGETGVLAVHPDAFVVRTSWVYHHEGRNFVRAMANASDRNEVKVVADQRGAPTYAADLAPALLALATRLRPIDGRRLLHLCAAGETHWADVAETIFRYLHDRDGRQCPRVRHITAAEWPAAARRPANSTLDCSMAAETYQLRLPRWENGLDRCLDRMLSASAAGTEAT